MIAHSGTFERVGGCGHFFPSLSAAAEAVGVDASQLPAGRRGGYLPATVLGGSGRNDAGRVSFHADGRGGDVFNFKTGSVAVWRDDAGRRMTPVERRRFQVEREAAEAKRREDEKARASEGAYTAGLIVRASRPVVNHPYLDRTRVRSVGRPLLEIDAKDVNEIIAGRGYRTPFGFSRIGYQGADGWRPMAGSVLAVPMWREGQLATLEFIDGAGHKSFLMKAPTGGAWWSTRTIGAAPVIGIAEGVATALSVDLVRGIPCIAAMSCGNLPRVAGWFARRMPDAQFLIFSDVGNGETDAQHAAEACGGRVELPSFTPELLEAFRAKTGAEKAPTDWNDYYVATGDLS